MDIDTLSKLYDKYKTIINSDIPYAMFMMELLSSYEDFKNMHFKECYKYSDTSLIKSTKLRYYIQVTLKEKINELFDKKIKELESEKKEYYKLFNEINSLYKNKLPSRDLYDDEDEYECEKQKCQEIINKKIPMEKIIPVEKRKEIHDKYLENIKLNKSKLSTYSNKHCNNIFINPNSIFDPQTNNYDYIRRIISLFVTEPTEYYNISYIIDTEIEEKINLLKYIKNPILGLIDRIKTKESYSYLIDSIIDINKANLSYEIYQKIETPESTNTDLDRIDLDSISICSGGFIWRWFNS